MKESKSLETEPLSSDIYLKTTITVKDRTVGRSRWRGPNWIVFEAAHNNLQGVHQLITEDWSSQKP